jgi:quercetin dioxygenase-like cupin family protein
MIVRRLAEALTYDAPNHRGCAALRLFGGDAAGPEGFAIAVSHFLPGGGAGPDRSPLDKLYFALAGHLTIIANGNEAVIGHTDSCFIAANEEREIINRTNDVATILVVTSPLIRST